MSNKAKIAFLCAFLAVVAAFVIQIMTGVWLNMNSVLLGVSGLFVVAAIAMDWKLYWEFLTMRTTKHGMNMGLMIVLVIAGTFCINYLANRHNKTWDVTKEKLNSLSEQTTKLLDGLKEDMNIKVFYKGPAAQDERQKIKQSLGLFNDHSSKLKVRYINAYVEQQEALQYLGGQSDRDITPVTVFVEYKGKRIRVDEPHDEAAFTSAMIKATREGESKIYFLKGHGERDIASDDDQGLKELAKALGESSFKVETLELVDKKEIPSDAAALAIIGPSVAYLDAEIAWLRQYLEKGGRLFLALDPGQRHNLANLTKSLGVEFQNNYVMTLAPIVGGGPATILARTFDAASDITKSFLAGSSFAVFPLASEVKPAPDKPATLEVKEIVKSDPYSFTMVDPTKPLKEKPATSSITVGVSAAGSMVAGEGKPEEQKKFEAVIFGDSDFVANRGLMYGVNRDLALNAFAKLANQTDLLSIKPKVPQGNIVTLTNAARWGVVIGGLSLPVLLLVMAGLTWFRRRGA